MTFRAFKNISHEKPSESPTGNTAKTQGSLVLGFAQFVTEFIKNDPTFQPINLPPHGGNESRSGMTLKKLGFWLGLLALVTWLGIPTIQQAIKIQNGKTCRENIGYIEEGKKRYIKEMGIPHPRDPERYIDLIPYMPLKNIPECPAGGTYHNVLNLNEPTTCPCNGKIEYEPVTPGVSLTNNGFHDTAKPAEAESFWQTPLQMLGIKKSERKAFNN